MLLDWFVEKEGWNYGQKEETQKTDSISKHWTCQACEMSTTI